MGTSPLFARVLAMSPGPRGRLLERLANLLDCFGVCGRHPVVLQRRCETDDECRQRTHLDGLVMPGDLLEGHLSLLGALLRLRDLVVRWPLVAGDLVGILVQLGDSLLACALRVSRKEPVGDIP